MAASAGITFAGTTIGYATTSGGIYTNFGEVTDVGDVGESSSPIDMTHAESPNGRREYIAGLADGNELTLTLNTTAALATLIEATLFNVTPMFYKFTLSNTNTLIVPAIMTAYSHAGQVGDAWRTSVTLKIHSAKVDHTGS